MKVKQKQTPRNEPQGTIIKKKIYLYVTSIYIFIFATNIHARIYKILPLTNLQKNHTLYLVSEAHIDSPVISLKQSKQLLHFLRVKKASLIVEDPCNTNKTHSLLELFIKNNHKKSALEYITSLARHTNHTATNIEFRSTTIKSYSHISVDQFTGETEDILQEIKQYDDNSIAKRYYDNIIQRHHSIKLGYTGLFTYMKNKKKTLSLAIEPPQEGYALAAMHGPKAAQQFKCLTNKKKIRQLLLLFNSELINARLIHSALAHQQQDHTKTILWAGGWHIEETLPTLFELGYCIDSPPVEVEDPHELGKYLQEICPDYDPDEELPLTMVDCLLKYSEFESNHPAITSIVKIATFLGTVAALGHLVGVLFAMSN